MITEKIPKDIYSWNELLEKWGKQDFELLTLFQQELQPYKKPGKEKICCPYEYHEYKFLHEEGRLDELSRVLTSLIYEPRRECERGWRRRKEPLPLSPWDVDINLLKDKAPDLLTAQNIKAQNIPASPERIEEIIITLKEESATLNAKMKQIIDEDPNLNGNRKKLSWKYFRLPDSYEAIRGLITKYELEEAIFKQADVFKQEGLMLSEMSKGEKEKEVRKLWSLMKVKRSDYDSDKMDQLRIQEKAISTYEKNKSLFPSIPPGLIKAPELYQIGSKNGARDFRNRLVKMLSEEAH